MKFWFTKNNKTEEPAAATAPTITTSDLHETIIPKFTSRPQQQDPQIRKTVLDPHYKTFSFYGMNFSMNAWVTSTELDTSPKHTASVNIFADDLLHNGTESLNIRNVNNMRESYDPKKIAHAGNVLRALGDYMKQTGHTCKLIENADWKVKNGKSVIAKGIPVLSITISPEHLQENLEAIQQTLRTIEDNYLKAENGEPGGKLMLGEIAYQDFHFHSRDFKNQEESWAERVSDGQANKRVEAIMQMAKKAFREHSTVSDWNYRDFEERIGDYFGISR